MNTSLAHWDARIRQMALHVLYRLARDVSSEAIMQSEIIVHIACVLYYVTDNIDQSLASDILLDISQIKDAQGTIMQSLRENGVAEAVVICLQSQKEAEKDTKKNTQNSRLVESCLYCLAVLSGNALFQPVLVQEEPFLILEQHLQHTNPNVQERVAWALSNLAVLDYGVHTICTTSALANVIGLLTSKTDAVVSSALRVVLSVSRKSAYHPFVKRADPSLAKLKMLQQHSLPNVKGAAEKLVQILSK